MSSKNQNAIRLLIIEDDPDDLLFLKENLGDSEHSKYNISATENLTKAAELLASGEFDLILLDLGLPESKGLETLSLMQKYIRNIPLIVITGLADEDTGAKAVQMGAEDYLVKGTMSPALLSRSIRYAIERFSLSAELQKAKQLKKQEAELQTLDSLERSGSSKITGQSLGIKSLNEHSPGTFRSFVEKLGEIMDKSVETRAYRVDYDLTADLRALADDLGFAFANPQDVVEVYSVALKDKMQAATYEASQVYLEEGRILLLKMMGYLLSFYRKYVPVNMIYKNEKKR
ncbi:MAG: response regulator [Prolixibacteraceae bacterium]